MESGRVKVTQMKRQYDFEIKGVKVFASCNEINRLTKPLQSRFMKIFLPRYTEEQFIAVSQKVLSKLKNELASYIGRLVFSKGGDIRNVISIWKLVKKSGGPAEIEQIMDIMTRYGTEEQEQL